MFSSSVLRGFLAAGAAATLMFGVVGCSSDGGDDDAAPIEVPGDAGTDVGAAGGDTADVVGEENEGGGEGGTSGGGNVTASYGPARGAASIDDIDDACAWIDVSEIEAMTGAELSDGEGFGVPGEDVQCDRESDDGRVWVQMAYKRAEPDLDLVEEFSGIPTIEWVEELDGVGEQAVVLEGPMGSAQVDIVDGDLWVMANVIVAGDGMGADVERSQQVALDLALLGIRAG